MKRLVPVLVFAVVVWPQPAAAQCATPPSAREALAETQAAFVGAVERSDSGVALVRVESIWLGDRLPELVEVHRESEPQDPLEVGDRYLFVTGEVQGGRAEQSDCSLTAPYTERIAALEPDSAIGPLNERTPMWIGIFIALLVVGAWQASRARRRVADLEP